MPTKPKAPTGPLNTYGCNTPGLTQFDYDRWAFAKRIPIDQGAPTRMELFRRISDRMLPKHFEWHLWTERVVNALCTYPLNGMPGAANSAKTFNVASFAVVWWLAYPDISSVTFVSTSIAALRKRGWAEIQKCRTQIQGPTVGNFVDSKMLWQIKKGDDKHSIMGRAVEQGSVTKVADDIKGVHTKRQMIVIDEATAVPEAIWDAITNLYSYPISSGGEFLLVAMANPRSRLEKFAQFIEPKDGWLSVDIEDEEWEGKPQPEYGGLPVQVTRFDAEKSPNIMEGRIVSRHLPTQNMVEAQRRNSGGGTTPNYFTNWRGFPPPEGLTKTVFTESALLKYDGYGHHTFTGRNFHIIGAFDPAFGGGDKPALRFAKLGEITNGNWGIEVMAPIVIPINVDSTNPVHFQLAEQLRRECESINNGAYSCPPENLAIDATGEGGGLCDIIARTWSPNIIRIEFNGKPSEDPCSLEDIRPAREVYDNKAAEMWFRSRDALNSGQLKGIDKETAIELCNREINDFGKRIRLQSKSINTEKMKSYRAKFGKSPDYADSLVCLSEVARRLGFRLAAVGQTVHKHEDWNERVKKSQAVYANVDYQQEEELEMEEAWV